jgi:8-oxo-dGTP pyrophosphatase MutT (NUDIX family)
MINVKIDNRRDINPKTAGPDLPLAEKISLALSNLEPRRLGDRFQCEAAVLIPIFEREGEPHFLLTVRTHEVETHKGQISFPGGMREEEEDLLQTALRETFEEVGIQSGCVEILGQFHDYLSITDFRVVPFAGYLRGTIEPKPHAREVAEVLYVPFRIFRDPSLMRIEHREIRGKMHEVYFYQFGSHVIWGLTARIIKDFLDLL